MAISSLKRLAEYFASQAAEWEQEQKHASNDYQIGYTKAAASVFKSCADLLEDVIKNDIEK